MMAGGANHARLGCSDGSPVSMAKLACNQCVDLSSLRLGLNDSDWCACVIPPLLVCDGKDTNQPFCWLRCHNLTKSAERKKALIC